MKIYANDQYRKIAGLDEVVRDYVSSIVTTYEDKMIVENNSRGDEELWSRMMKDGYESLLDQIDFYYWNAVEKYEEY